MSLTPNIPAEPNGCMSTVASSPHRSTAKPLSGARQHLRRLYRVAAGVSLDWELLAQGVQAAKQVDLIDLAQRCHLDMLRQMRWANGMLKALSPQFLAS